jgi:hypothetical protein
MYLSFLFQKYIFKLIHSNNIHVCDAVWHFSASKQCVSMKAGWLE